MTGPDLLLACSCGGRVPVRGEKFICACGRQVGRVENGVVVLKERTPYWGEIPEATMNDLLARSERDGYRKAVKDLFGSKDMEANIMSPDRAAFQDVLPIPEGSLVMDLGAGLGAVATSLAKRYRVVALEGVWERSRFIAIRKEQDKLDNLTVINSDANDMPLADGQFECITLIGVLEWVALFDQNGDPQEVQRRFLERLRKLLSPTGRILIGIENRFGWSQMAGSLDHSGLPYTSLMPRWMARWVCSRPTYRSASNSGYRTYTYSYYGFQRLFRQAGLDIAENWIAPTSYHRPVAMIPLHQPAIEAYVRSNWIRPAVSWKDNVKNYLKTQTSRAWFWRWFGSDYVFLLKSS